jgi:hypothetical protein
MKRAPTSKSSTCGKEQMAAAIAAAPDKVTDAECPYDPNDAASVIAFYLANVVRKSSPSRLR